MIDLNEQVFGLDVVVQEIPRDPCALRHPVEPDSSNCLVNMIVHNLHVDRGMELDARHLGTREQPPDVDVVNGIPAHHAEHDSQATDNARLLAVRDGVVANDVVADRVLVPAVLRARSIVLT